MQAAIHIPAISILGSCLLGVAGLTSEADAAVVVYEVVWSGAAFGNSASAVASIEIDTSAIPNPGFHLDIDPRTMPPWICSLTLTVSGAGTGNGVFAITDFQGVFWDTEGAALDLAKELVGQPTTDQPWGSTNDSRSGDFNLFRADASPTAPSGTAFFELSPYSQDSEMRMKLTSFRPVPEPSIWLLWPLGAGALLFLRRRG